MLAKDFGLSSRRAARYKLRHLLCRRKVSQTQPEREPNSTADYLMDGGPMPLLNARCCSNSDHLLRHNKTSQRAKTGCEQSQQAASYSITSSARACDSGGTSMTSWNFVDCITGKSADFSPLSWP
jgi:hypothetical protein